MRIFLRVLLSTALILLTVVAITLGWFFFYSNDIPKFDTLAGFAPTVPATELSDCPAGSVSVLPYSLIGQNVLKAARAAEGDDRNFALHVARSMFCNHQGRMLRRHLLEYKAFVQVRRRYSLEQLLTIYLNKAYFGDGGIGIENAAEHYYGKRSSDLDVPEAAMIAGLLKAPRMYSPDLHPDKAKIRRDAVLTSMSSRGFITPIEAEAAMQSPVR
jgi:membrane carboxypeptidase/penicillin-binding protein